MMSPTTNIFLAALLAACASVSVNARASIGNTFGVWRDATDVCNDENLLTYRCNDDCDEVQFCTIKDDEYTWETLRKCTLGHRCHGTQCVPEGMSTCPVIINKVTCNKNNIGRVPHPHKCRKYFDCGDLDEETDECGENFMFSACTGGCDWKYNEDECAKTKIDCETLGYGVRGAVYSNRRLYFVCDVANGQRFPEYYSCDPGEIFDDKTKQCEEYSGPGCGIAK